MLTVKVVTEDGISIYQADKITYRIHACSTLADFIKTDEMQVFLQMCGDVEYVGLYDIPDEQQAPIDFLSIYIKEDTLLLIGKPANVFIMNENGKTVEKINL